MSRRDKLFVKVQLQSFTVLVHPPFDLNMFKNESDESCYEPKTCRLHEEQHEPQMKDDWSLFRDFFSSPSALDNKRSTPSSCWEYFQTEELDQYQVYETALIEPSKKLLSRFSSLV